MRTPRVGRVDLGLRLNFGSVREHFACSGRNAELEAPRRATDANNSAFTQVLRNI